MKLTKFLSTIRRKFNKTFDLVECASIWGCVLHVSFSGDQTDKFMCP